METMEYLGSPTALRTLREPARVAAVVGCLGCPNFTSCRQLKTEELHLETAHKTHIESYGTGRGASVATRRIRILLSHLQRQRFLFPFVEDYKSCWYHDKFGVVQNLIMYAQRLLKEKAA